MSATVDASTLSLEDVHRLLKLEKQLSNSFASLLSVEPLTDSEQQDLEDIRGNFETYYTGGLISEGEVKFLLVSPLLWLSGFYQPSLKISLEEKIADINIEDEDTVIKGRMDILAVKKPIGKTRLIPFWILLIEAKNSRVDASEGLPQLLTYACKSLEHQEAVWGLTTNGMDYQFVYIQRGNPPTYQPFPKLSLMYPEQSIELLQVLKAICTVAREAEPAA